ncbi:hypothetical protein OG709_30095 [Streptomyces sp. NBC_01267]|uniref:hypothetical protein n=1 Tax=Streptomyces sp. NBC_01267 TaxID=2903805 RepID=UPI002E31B1C2|nr:hypothetical protein [Streptomyces sp. NBC_01267]
MSQIIITDEQIAAAQAGDGDAMWEIVSACEPMIKGLIHSVAPGATADEADNLLQEGRTVLLERLRDYDSTRSTAALYTYAYTAVRRAIMEEAVRTSTPLTVDPGSVIRVRRAMYEADGNEVQALRALSSDPDPRNRMSAGKFANVWMACQAPESFDAPLPDEVGESLTVADILPDASADFTQEADRVNLAHWLMTKVSVRQSYALRAFHGVGMESVPDNLVAADMAIKHSTLRQLRKDGASSAKRVADKYNIAA